MKAKTWVVLLFVLLSLSACSKKPIIITESQLIEAISIDELSTAEFVHNGIAQIEKGNKTYNVSYPARVKVGIDMSEVSFEIDNEAKTVDIILPEIVVNQVSVDSSEISYIPSDPKLGLPEVLSACEADALEEANSTDQVRQIAQDNLKAAIDALISPILKGAGYRIGQWKIAYTTTTWEVIG